MQNSEEARVTYSITACVAVHDGGLSTVCACRETANERTKDGRLTSQAKAFSLCSTGCVNCYCTPKCTVKPMKPGERRRPEQRLVVAMKLLKKRLQNQLYSPQTCCRRSRSCHLPSLLM